ncbi:MAG TPA: hypothetical protein VGO93_02505 [Candidatus Xenobia bacterium]
MRRLQSMATVLGLLAVLVAPLGAQTPSATETVPASETPAPSGSPSVPEPTPLMQPSPEVAPTTKARAIWDYQKELGLTDDQVAKIKKTVRDLQDKADAAQTRYTASQKAYATLMEKSGDLEQIRTRMHEMADIQIDMQIENLRAKRALRKVITPAQMQKWQEIQKSAQH